MSATVLVILVLAVALAAFLLLRTRSRGNGKTASSERASPIEGPSASGSLDENVQFTVFRPAALEPGRWHTMLAFAHLSEKRPEAPAHEPDPVEEVQKQAAALLGDTSRYRQHTEDSLQAVPRQGALTFVPAADGVEFNPSSRAFDWTEAVHREEFRMRAGEAMAGRVVRGRVTVYLGAIVVAEIGMALRVEAKASAGSAESASDHARPYRKVFASYSHRDSAIVDEFAEYARAMGDKYLRDVIDLRSGEQWRPALEQLIQDADVFQLFWSWNAIESPYVQQEWVYALSLKRRSFVRPVYWNEPLPERGGMPPASLRELHFERIHPRPITSSAAGAPAQVPGSRPLPKSLLSALAAAALLAVFIPTVLVRMGQEAAPPGGMTSPAPTLPVDIPPQVRARQLVQEAEVAWVAGQSESALADLQKALLIAPADPSARALLARVERDVNTRLNAATAGARKAGTQALRPQAHAQAQRDEREAQTAAAAGRPIDAVRRRMAAATTLEGAARGAAVRPPPPDRPR